MTSDECSSPPSQHYAEPVRVLFLAWGFSIHAQRRIQIFVDDPHFDVTVVSTHAYDFPGARTVRLTKAYEMPERNSWERLKFCYRNRIATSAKKPPVFSHALETLQLPGKFLIELHHLFLDRSILKSTIDDFKPDVIFLQTLLYPNYLAYLCPPSIPILVTFWNGDVLWWAKLTGLERLFKKQIVKYGVHRAIAVTVNSTLALEACINYGKDRKDIHVIRYPGIDREQFQPLRKDMSRKKLGIAAEKVVLWPRGSGSYLNLDILIEAAPRVLERYPEATFLLLFSTTVVDPVVQQQIGKLGMEESFILKARVDFSEMPLYYSSADVTISISSNDSLPNTMLEAMACGSPVIMGDIPQITEWVRDGENGYVVPVRDSAALADRIIRIFDKKNRALIQSFIRKNATLIEQEVDSKKMSRQIKNLVLSIATRSQQRSNGEDV